MATEADYKTFLRLMRNESALSPPGAGEPQPSAPKSGFRRPTRIATREGGGSFALRLLSASGFGESSEFPAGDLLGQRTAQSLRNVLRSVRYFKPAGLRAHAVILAEFHIDSRQLLVELRSLFDQEAKLQLIEQALDRLARDILEAFDKPARSEGLPRGDFGATLCVLSVPDHRAFVTTGNSLVHFSAGTETSGSASSGEDVRFVETITIRQVDVLDLEGRDRHLRQFYFRSFSKLAATQWRDAFARSEEVQKIELAAAECLNPGASPEQIAVKVMDLLECIAQSFLPTKAGKQKILTYVALPTNHDIGADPEGKADKREGGPGTPPGIIIRDNEDRLLGYVLYCLGDADEASQLRTHLEKHNRFHNVLVLYPQNGGVDVELWQGQRLLRDRLTRNLAQFTRKGRVVSFLSGFFVVSQNDIVSPEELAKELAFRAQYLRKFSLLQLPYSQALKEVYSTFKTYLLHNQSEVEFADAYAQTITYGLLAARWSLKDSQHIRFSRASARQHLPVSSPFLRHLFDKVLNAEYDLHQLWLVDDIADLLDRVDVRAVFSSVEDADNASPDPVIHFYEPFLAAYDPALRKDRGVFYTPEPIVDFMVSAVDHVLGVPGIARSEVNILDPATGTGTFLRSIIRRVKKNLREVRPPSESSDQEGAEIIPSLLKRLRGFEWMVASYAICHLRIMQEIGDVRDGVEAPRIGVLLTDTLDRLPPATSELYDGAMTQEAEAAYAVKRAPWADVIVGNPPYKNNSRATLAQIAVRFPALLRSSASVSGAQKRNIRDDYAWFFAASDAYLKDGGYLCFVTSDSYLRVSSYQNFRREILASYDVQFVITLGGSVFKSVSYRIGFAIIVMRKSLARSGPDATPRAFRYADLSLLVANVSPQVLGTRDDPRFKLLAQADGDVELLSSNSVSVVSHQPSMANEFRFVPGSAGDADALSNVDTAAEKIESLFVKKWPGLITSFDGLFKSDSHAVLTARMRRFFDLAQENDTSGLLTLATELGLKGDNVERLTLLAGQARQKPISYSAKCIRKINQGSIPDSARWYPPRKHQAWIYFEPGFKVPRNVHPNKSEGWGTMSQWRPLRTHEIFPKLIFTTSTNKKYGFKSFVVDGDWFTKSHGATSQQYHYVSLTNPGKGSALDGKPNNLTLRGQAWCEALVRSGRRPEDMLHVISAFYNSTYAARYLLSGKGSMLPLPTLGSDGKALASLADSARSLRDLKWIAEELSPSSGLLDLKSVPTVSGTVVAELFGISAERVHELRAASSASLMVTDDVRERLENRTAELQESVDTLVGDLIGE